MQHHHSRARRGGFTLVEIIVVLAIAALISSIVFSAFKSIREGNKKTSCQTNLAQIYQALRLYGQDFNGELPSFNPSNTVTVTGSAPDGLGLWALYAYPVSSNRDCDGRTTQLPATEGGAAPLASYVKSPALFHCPYDDYDRDVAASAGCVAPSGVKTLNSSQITYTGTDNQTHLNPFYNSYQTADDIATDTLDKAPYSSFRGAKVSRQLAYYDAAAVNRERRTPDTTIITWCRFHRKIDKDGKTVDRVSNYDNVLFLDGTVQYLPTKQGIGTSTGANACAAWRRAPLETVGSLTKCPDDILN